MYLANLSLEQKAAFLNLAQALIDADNRLRKEELELMAQYRQEVGFTSDFPVDATRADAAITLFTSAPTEQKKQILFELVALAFSDREYAVQEQNLITQIAARWGFDAQFLQDCVLLTQELERVYNKITLFVGK